VEDGGRKDWSDAVWEFFLVSLTMKLEKELWPKKLEKAGKGILPRASRK
jgi:hypothetical protein